ncbi:RDD family protein [Streptomyces sp. NPDC004838]
MSALVTGDAVVLGLQPAKLPSRALAIVIDLLVVVGAYVAISVVLTLTTSSLDDAAFAAVSIATSLLVLVGVPIVVETLSRGRSLGKLACGLRVVRDDGGPIRFRHALVRGAMGMVEILMTFGVVACIASLVSARGRRVGDVFAGTLVVRERVPAARVGVVPPPPPWLVGRFAELDLSGVPDELWLAIRQYLMRMRQLDPAVSWSMAQRLAAELAERTGAPAPEGVAPAAYVAAVVNERQVRDARRAFGSRPGGGGAAAYATGVGFGPGDGAVSGEGGYPGSAVAPVPEAGGAPDVMGGAGVRGSVWTLETPETSPQGELARQHGHGSAVRPVPGPVTREQSQSQPEAEGQADASGEAGRARPGTGFVPPS